MTRGLAAFAATVLLVTGCASTPASTSDYVAMQQVRLKRPEGGARAGAAIYFHGQGGDETSEIDGEWLGALVDEGWAVATSNFHRNAWGNQAVVDHTAALAQWVRQQTGMPVTLFVANSMGGANSLNALILGDADPSCWYGVQPVVDLHEVDTVPNAQGQLEEAHDGPVTERWNPADNFDELPAGTTYRVLASPQDTMVAKSEHTDVLVSGLRERGVDVTAVEVQGVHGDPSHFDADDLVDFAAGCQIG